VSRLPSSTFFLHSPGGSIEAAEAIVTYLRSKFAHIRAIVPHSAMSAATMIAMACDEIVMGKHSFLGLSTHSSLADTPGHANGASSSDGGTI